MRNRNNRSTTSHTDRNYAKLILQAPEEYVILEHTQEYDELGRIRNVTHKLPVWIEDGDILNPVTGQVYWDAKNRWADGHLRDTVVVRVEG